MSQKERTERFNKNQQKYFDNFKKKIHDPLLLNMVMVFQNMMDLKIRKTKFVIKIFKKENIIALLMT